MAQPQAAEARRIHGMVVMTLQGDLVWSVWLNNGVSISVAKLCQTVASFFANEAQNQNSSYLEAGSFAAASTLDFDTIVTILCPKSVLETEVCERPLCDSTIAAQPLAPLGPQCSQLCHHGGFLLGLLLTGRRRC
jgi:hypothetical protein